MRLKAPQDVTRFRSSSGQAYDVEDGHVEIENTAHAAEALAPSHGFKVATAAPSKPAAASAAADDDDGSGDDQFTGMTKSDLRDWLDERDLDYPPKASKEILLGLARAAPAEADED